MKNQAIINQEILLRLNLPSTFCDWRERMTDPIADMLSRIRNCMAVGKDSLQLPHSKIKESLGRLLVSSGFLKDTRVGTEGQRKFLEVVINEPGSPPTITEIKRLSRPGRRQFVKASQIPTIKHGRGIVIVSTSKGLMTGADAKTKQLGGELICEVY